MRFDNWFKELGHGVDVVDGVEMEISIVFDGDEKLFYFYKPDWLFCCCLCQPTSYSVRW